MATPTAATAETAKVDETMTEADKVSTGTATTTASDKTGTAATYTAETVADKDVAVDAAQGKLSEESSAKLEEIRQLTEPFKYAQIEKSVADAAKAKNVEGVLSSGAYADEVKALDINVSETPDAEKQTREAITGVPADGTAAQIIDQVGYEASKQREVKGTAAKGAAATMVAETANIPEDIAAAIVEDPASVEAQVDNEPVEVQAAIAALPTEALVSSQMETLLAGM